MRYFQTVYIIVQIAMWLAVIFLFVIGYQRTGWAVLMAVLVLSLLRLLMWSGGIVIK